MGEEHLKPELLIDVDHATLLLEIQKLRDEQRRIHIEIARLTHTLETQTASETK